MLGIFYAVITVLAWGTWLAPSQNIPFKNQQIKTFYVAIAMYWQNDPQPKARAATLTLIGCVLAMIGGVVLGNLK